MLTFAYATPRPACTQAACAGACKGLTWEHVADNQHHPAPEGILLLLQYGGQPPVMVHHGLAENACYDRTDAQVSGLPRCEWCGCFVSPNKPLTAWRVQVPAGSRQDLESIRNYWARLLCDRCGDCTHVPPVWERTTVDEVLRQRGALRADVVRR